MATMASAHRRKKQLKNPPLEQDTSDLPCDIIHNILCRLPVKSLLRFKSVSKPWKSIISDPQVAKSHLRLSKDSNSPEVRVLSRSNCSNQLFKFTKNGLLSEGLLEFPVKKYRFAQILCSYDGLVLLKNTAKSDQIYVIWNLSTGTHTRFRCPHRFDTVGYRPRIVLCYDQSTDDYKVLFLRDAWYLTFSYRNNSWSEMKYYSSIGCPEYIDIDGVVVVHGVPHWIVLKKFKEVRSSEIAEQRLKLLSKKCKNYGCVPNHYINHPVYVCDYRNTREICYFDPKDEELKKFPMPACLDDTCVFDLVSLRNQLCLYRNTYDASMIEIYMMKEYGNSESWTKLLTMKNMPPLHDYDKGKPLYFRSECEIVVQVPHSLFVIYDTTKEEFRDPRLYKVERPLLIYESLVLPSMAKGCKRKRSEISRNI